LTGVITFPRPPDTNC